MAKRENGPLSLRGFARRLKVSHTAVEKAVAAGRLSAAVVGRDPKNRPVILDVAKARMEWEANASKPTKPGGQSSALVDAQRAVAIERAEQLKFDNARRRGEYVLLVDQKREAFESGRIIREGLLNLPTRLAPELAAETDPQRIFARLDAEIRAALHGIADALEHAS